MSESDRRKSLGELARLFLRLGFTAFGGPPVHIAMMRDEIVERRGWMSADEFTQLLGASNLIPGPTSTQMALAIGWLRGSGRGLLLAGVCFIGPAVLLTTILAWAYVRFGSLTAAGPILAGIKPAVVAVVAVAVWRLGKPVVVKHPLLIVIGVGVMIVVLLGANEVFAMFGGGIFGMILLRARQMRARTLTALSIILVAARSVATTQMAVSITLAKLVGFFLEVGAVLFGGGYVLAAIVQGRLVERWGWLTPHELADSIAAGQFTPGPVLSTAAFIGYVVGAKQPGAGNGMPMAYALAASIAIFLPSFVFVPVLQWILPRVRRWPWTSDFLDAITISAVALIACVDVQLIRATMIVHRRPEWRAVAMASVALGASLVWKRLNAAWVILAGALAGWIVFR
jgi:chromate transporter